VGTAYGMITGGAYPNLVILDVRTKGEYDSGHIYGATLIPVADLPTRIGELAGHVNDEILVYCGSGGRSQTASGILDSNGFTKVYNMLGGITAWKSAGYPTWIATVHDLNTTFNYDTIQAAIESALTTDGNTIFVDNGTYHEHVVVGKTLSIVGAHLEDTVIDGNGTGTAISITADNATVESFTIRNGSESGIYLHGGNHAQIHNNKIINNYCGVNISSSYNLIFDNEITGNQFCGLLITAGSSTIFGNNVTSNNYGICLNSSQASNNLIYHNNIINNTYQASTNEAAGLWDNGYPSGGNYWNDYNGTDLFSGVFQNLKGSDGVGDVAHTIDANNTDRYPLILRWIWGPAEPDNHFDRRWNNESSSWKLPIQHYRIRRSDRNSLSLLYARSLGTRRKQRLGNVPNCHKDGHRSCAESRIRANEILVGNHVHRGRRHQSHSRYPHFRGGHASFSERST